MRPGPWGVLLGRRLEERGWRGQRDSGSPSKGSDSVPPVRKRSGQRLCPPLLGRRGDGPADSTSNGLFASSSATWWTYIRRVSRDVFIGAVHATAFYFLTR